MFRLVQTGLNVCFNVRTVTKKWGYEMTWCIGCHDGSSQQCVSIPGGKLSKYDDYAEYNQECCLPETQQSFLVKCTDSWGDGWNGGYLEINGTNYCTDFLVGYEKEESMTSLTMYKY